MSSLNIKEPSQDVQTMLVRYTYEWRDIVPTNERDTSAHPSRPFCKKMIELSASGKTKKRGKMWSMADIQNMSFKLGYSVLDRAGGFWNDKRNNTPYQCRHEWYANIVTKKK